MASPNFNRKRGFSLRMTIASKKMLKRQPTEFKKGAREGSKDAIKLLGDDSKRGFGGANQLQIRTGYLRRSIVTSIKEDGNIMTGAIGSTAIYAAIHEFGGVISSSAKQYLMFKGGGGWVKAASVTIPKRPFLSPIIEGNISSMRSQIIKGINKEMMV